VKRFEKQHYQAASLLKAFHLLFSFSGSEAEDNMARLILHIA
jgi:hypothetical protein